MRIELPINVSVIRVGYTFFLNAFKHQVVITNNPRDTIVFPFRRKHFFEQGNKPFLLPFFITNDVIEFRRTCHVCPNKPN